jgi:hypothetical protein
MYTLMYIPPTQRRGDRPMNKRKTSGSRRPKGPVLRRAERSGAPSSERRRYSAERVRSPRWSQRRSPAAEPEGQSGADGERSAVGRQCYEPLVRSVLGPGGLVGYRAHLVPRGEAVR